MCSIRPAGKAKVPPRSRCFQDRGARFGGAHSARLFGGEQTVGGTQILEVVG